MIAAGVQQKLLKIEFDHQAARVSFVNCTDANLHGQSNISPHLIPTPSVIFEMALQIKK